MVLEGSSTCTVPAIVDCDISDSGRPIFIMTSETVAEAKVSTGFDGHQIHGLQECVGIERTPTH